MIFTISDYSIFLYNLYDLHVKFKNTLELIAKTKDDCMKTGRRYIPELVEKKKLGFELKDCNSEIEQFKMFIQEKICKGNYGDNFIVNRIDLCYKLEELMKYQKELEATKEKISRINFPKIKEKNNNYEGGPLTSDDRKYFESSILCSSEVSLSELKKEKNELQEKIDKLVEDSKNNTLKYFGGAAFVTFDSIKEQELYLRNLPNNSIEYFIKFLRDIVYLFCSCCVNKSSENIYYLKRNVKFEAAPEPEDIIFENLETKPIIKIMRTFLVYLISFLICGISFIIIVILNKLQEYFNNKNIVILYIISLIISTFTSGIDFTFQIILEFLTKQEKPSSWTDFYLSYSVKLTIFSFFNSAVLPLFSELFFNKSDGYEILINNMIIKFLTNSFFTPLMWTLNFNYYMKKIKICFINKHIEEVQNDKNIIDKKNYFHKYSLCCFFDLENITQKELNNLYELPSMNVSMKYSYIFKTLLMSFLYIPIFPLRVIISLFGFLLGYALEKYNFGNRYKKPEMLNRQIVQFYVDYFIVVLFIYGVGDYIFLSRVYDSKAWSLVNIIVFGVAIIIPYHHFLSKDYIKFNESLLHNKKYDEAYLSFNTDYERANPMTKKEGNIRYYTKLKDKGIINQSEYDKRISEFNNFNIMESYFNQRTNYLGRSAFNNYSSMRIDQIPWNNDVNILPTFENPINSNLNYINKKEIQDGYNSKFIEPSINERLYKRHINNEELHIPYSQGINQNINNYPGYSSNAAAVYNNQLDNNNGFQPYNHQDNNIGYTSNS